MALLVTLPPACPADDLGPTTPPQELEFPSLCFGCTSELMTALVEQLEAADVARLTAHAEGMQAYEGTYEAARKQPANAAPGE